MVHERHLTKEDISAILKRAVQLQAADTEAELRSLPGEDLTLHELRQSAAEVGIAPRFIEAAAAERPPNPPETRAASLWGSSWIADAERTVEGEVTEQSWPGMVETIERTSGMAGIATRTGGTFEWTSSMPEVLDVAMTPCGGATHIRVLARNGTAGVPVLVGYLSLALGVLPSLATVFALHLPPLVGLPLVAAWSTGAFAGARWAVRRLIAQRRGVVLALLRRLESRVWSADRPPALTHDASPPSR